MTQSPPLNTSLPVAHDKDKPLFDLGPFPETIADIAEYDN